MKPHLRHESWVHAAEEALRPILVKELNELGKKLREAYPDLPNGGQIELIGTHSHGYPSGNGFLNRFAAFLLGLYDRVTERIYSSPGIRPPAYPK